MNGFIVLGKGTESLRVHPNGIAPLGRADACHKCVLPGNDTLLAWGKTEGDIHWAVRNKESFLILSGYVLEIQGGSELRSPAEAAETLLQMLDGASSNVAIAEVLRRLYGSFGIFYRNTVSDKTVCISDAVASRPMWRKWNDGSWVVSSHAAAIAKAVRTTFDPTVLGAFLLYGASVEPTRSLFTHVKAVPPGTILQLNGDGIVEEYRWYQFRHQPDLDRPVENWVKIATERLVQAASRLVCVNRQPAIFFSGGVDSRLTAAALKAAGGDPVLVTLGDNRNLEVQVASAAAKALGLRHKVILRDKHWYFRALPQAVYQTGAGYVFTHGHFSVAARQVHDEFGTDSFLLGDLCEAFSKLFCSVNGNLGRLWMPEEFVGAFDCLRLPHYRPLNAVDTLSLLNARVRTYVKQALRCQILERYQKLSCVSTDPLIVGDYFFRWESAPTLPTFYMFLDLRAVAAERNIMFDRDVYEMLQWLPSDLRHNKNFGARLIHRLRPLAAWIPNSNTLLPLCLPPAAHELNRRVKPLLGKIRRKLVGGSHRTTGAWPNHAFLYVTDAAWRKTFEAVFADLDLFDGEIFDRDAIQQSWQAFLKGDHWRVADVEKLLQLGLTTKLLRSDSASFVRDCALSDSAGNERCM
jgi:hypothetical protein